VLRERLRRIDLKVFVWFRKRAGRKGYDLDRIRATAEVGPSVCYEYASKDASSLHTPVPVERWYDSSDFALGAIMDTSSRTV
jgi:hypothetical protein